MSELYKYPVCHMTKLTDIRPGRCRVLVRAEHAGWHYHTGGIAAWFDKRLARETGRPLSTYAQRRAELAERGEE